MADCSKLSDFFDEAARLCGCCNSDCNKLCPFFPDDCIMITVDQKGYFMDLAKSVQEWSDEHPAQKPKTYADVFFEQHPKAEFKYVDGIKLPKVCRQDVYGDIRCYLLQSRVCKDCWLEPYEEEEE